VHEAQPRSNRSRVERLVVFGAETRFHCPTERGGIDGGIAVELGLDGLEVTEDFLGIYELSLQHLPDILRVLRMTPLDFGKRLCIEVVVVEGEFALPGDVYGVVLPAGKLGNEIGGGGQLDVDLKGLLQAGQGAEQSVTLGKETNIDVDGGLTPSEENSGGAAGEVKTAVGLRLGT